MRQCNSQTETSPMTKKQLPTVGKPPKITWYTPPKKARVEELIKNIAVASALLICMVMLRSGAAPTADVFADAVLAAASDDTLLNDRLGKLSFVSTLFPEAVLVFGQGHIESIAMPVQASATIHTWSENEPYVAWLSDSTCVFAAISGEVAGVYHGMDEELIIQITNDQQTSCITGNLQSVNVDVGDYIQQGELIGWIGEGSFCSFEVQDNGRSIDPALLMEDSCSAS